MTSVLVALLGDTPDNPLSWARVERGVITHNGQADNLAALCARIAEFNTDTRIMGVLRGDVAACHVMPAPPKGRAKFLAAARLLLEDELAEPVDGIHIALGEGPSGEGRVIAVRAAIVETWRDSFLQSGHQLDILTCDFLCLPGAPSRVIVFAADGRLVVNDGRRGFSAEETIGDDLLGSLLTEANNAAASDEVQKSGDATAPVSVGLYASFVDRAASDNDQWKNFQHVGAATTETMIQFAAAYADENKLLNLLQGAFRPARRTRVQFGVWRRAAVLAVVAVGLSLFGALADAHRAGVLASHYQSEAFRIHAEAFPAANTSDIRRHARNQLASGGAASFIDIARRLEQAVAVHDGISIDRIRFDISRGVFVFSLQSRSNSEIDAFRAGLQSAGLNASDSSGYRRRGAVWVGDMSVSLR